jgi:hypothetical protein
MTSPSPAPNLIEQIRDEAAQRTGIVRDLMLAAAARLQGDVQEMADIGAELVRLRDRNLELEGTLAEVGATWTPLGGKPRRPAATLTFRIEADCSHALAELERLKATIAEAAEAAEAARAAGLACLACPTEGSAR